MTSNVLWQGGTDTVPWDGQRGPWLAVWLLHEQPVLLCCCRHGATARRHSPAPELRAHVLGRCSDDAPEDASCGELRLCARRQWKVAKVEEASKLWL